MNQTVAITGANGFIGRALVNYFLQAGWHVKALVRHPEKLNKWNGDNPIEKFEAVAYQLEVDPHADLLRGVDVVVHAALITPQQNIRAAAINLTALQNLLTQCEHFGTKMIYISSFSAHEGATSIYGKSKLSCEAAVELSKHVVVKPGLVIGDGGLFKNIKEQVKAHRLLPLIDGGKQPLQTIAIEDLCAIILKCAQEKLTGKFWLASTDVMSMKAFYQSIAAANKTKNILLPVPYLPVYWLLSVAEWLHIQLPITSENIKGLRQLKAFETVDSLRQLNYKLEKLSATLSKLAS